MKDELDKLPENSLLRLLLPNTWKAPPSSYENHSLTLARDQSQNSKFIDSLVVTFNLDDVGSLNLDEEDDCSISSWPASEFSLAAPGSMDTATKDDAKEKQ
jgi:hypothetical protein